MSKKQPNKLAKLIDHQTFAGSALPQTLADNMRLYVEATDKVKELLVDCLPNEILDTCWVVGLSAEKLTLSVTSTTAANHIRYLQKAYLRVLTEQSFTFQQLKHIHVVVVSKPSNSHYSQKLEVLTAASSKQSKTVRYQALSQNTKRTISQAAEHVITDKKLKDSLLRLLNEEK